MGSKQQARGYAVNVVDSCGWLEHLIGGSNAQFFEPILLDQDQLLIPQLVIYEVCRRVLQFGAPGTADKVFRSMSALRVVTLDADGAYMAAQSAIRYKLHMADAIIWQTAQTHGAALYTQDAALAQLPGVRYQAKP
jgi:predicted nucleic acid-binding protein